MSEKITYHVGWRKGTINFNNNMPETPKSLRDYLLKRYIWRSAAFLPLSLQFICLGLLPLLSIALIIKLVYMLLHY